MLCTIIASNSYTGLTKIKSRSHSRYAVMAGAVLLAATGGVWNSDLDSFLINLTGFSPDKPDVGKRKHIFVVELYLAYLIASLPMPVYLVGWFRYFFGSILDLIGSILD